MEAAESARDLRISRAWMELQRDLRQEGIEVIEEDAKTVTASGRAGGSRIEGVWNLQDEVCAAQRSQELHCERAAYDRLLREVTGPRTPRETLHGDQHGRASLEQKRRGRGIMERSLAKGGKPIGACPPEIVREAAYTASYFSADGTVAEGFRSDLASSDASWFAQMNSAATEIQKVYRGHMGRVGTRLMAKQKGARGAPRFEQALAEYQALMKQVADSKASIRRYQGEAKRRSAASKKPTAERS